MPGELHKLWKSGDIAGYHMEYGFCMGYEIPAAIGVNLAEPDRPKNICWRRIIHDDEFRTINCCNDGHFNYYTQTDNRGFGCINRLQKSTGEPFNNLFKDSHHQKLPN